MGEGSPLGGLGSSSDCALVWGDVCEISLWDVEPSCPTLDLICRTVASENNWYVIEGFTVTKECENQGRNLTGLVPNGAQKRPAQGPADRGPVGRGGSEVTTSVRFHWKRLSRQSHLEPELRMSFAQNFSEILERVNCLQDDGSHGQPTSDLQTSPLSHS